MDHIPPMTREEEVKFWESHDATHYPDDIIPVEVTMGPRPHNRCPVCQKVLLSRFVNIEIADGQAVLRDLRELYCQDGHIQRLAPEAQRMVDAVEAVLRLVPRFSPVVQTQEVTV